MTHTVYCIKLKKQLKGLDAPPMPNALGQKIYEQVSEEAWQSWSKFQTMLINENRLNMADKRARDYLKQQLEYYFFAEDSGAMPGSTV